MAKKNAKKKQPEKSKLTLVPSPINQKQLLHIIQRTPTEHIYHRPAKGGGDWEYVTGAYVKKVLNYIFAWMWDFEIREHGKEDTLVWVLGRLTIKNRSGKPMIVKEQFGRAEIKFKRGTKSTLDFGNDLKAAATDSLKKCASELGIASDIYGKEEFKEIQQVDKGFIPPVNGDKPALKIKAGPDADKKINELKKILKGNTDEQKQADLKKRTGVNLKTFGITEKHASLLIATLLNAETKRCRK